MQLFLEMLSVMANSWSGSALFAYTILSNTLVYETLLYSNFPDFQLNLTSVFSFFFFYCTKSVEVSMAKFSSPVKFDLSHFRLNTKPPYTAPTPPLLSNTQPSSDFNFLVCDFRGFPGVKWLIYLQTVDTLIRFCRMSDQSALFANYLYVASRKHAYIILTPFNPTFI